MSSKYLFIIIFLVIPVWLFSCSCLPPNFLFDVERYFESDLIIRGIVIGSKHESFIGQNEAKKSYILRIEKVYKGELKHQEINLTWDFVCSSIKLKQEDRYILYLDKDLQEDETLFEVNNCSLVIIPLHHRFKESSRRFVADQDKIDLPEGIRRNLSKEDFIIKKYRGELEHMILKRLGKQDGRVKVKTKKVLRYFGIDYMSLPKYFILGHLKDGIVHGKLTYLYCDWWDKEKKVFEKSIEENGKGKIIVETINRISK